jgi:hypothetical protein
MEGIMNATLNTCLTTETEGAFAYPTNTATEPARAKVLDDAAFKALVKTFRVTMKTQHIVDAIRATGNKASLGRVNKVLGRYTSKTARQTIVTETFMVDHSADLADAHVTAQADFIKAMVASL